MTVRKLIVISASALALSLAACGGSGSDKSNAAVSGDMSANLPLGLPLMEGATVVNNNNGKGGAEQLNATAILNTESSVEDTYEYYSSAMDNAGFGNKTEVDVEDILNLTANKDGVTGMINVRPEGGKTTVMIIMRGEPY